MTSGNFPKTADIVIIGGGAVGTATAYYLSKSGIKNIVVLEKNTVGSGSTGRCGAGMRAQWGNELNCRMALAAINIFEHLDEELGFPTGLNQSGYVFVAYNDKEWEQFHKNVELQRRVGVMTEIFSDKKRMQTICPGVAVDDAVGFTFHARDGHADPFLTTNAFQEAAKQNGARFFKRTEVTGINVCCGRVVNVVTTRGTINTGTVINCAGSWAQEISAMVGIKIPNWAERHQVLVTEPVEPGVCPAMLMSMSGNYYVQQRPNGSIIAGRDSSKEKKLGYALNVNVMADTAQMVLKLLPRTKNIRVVRMWSGYYDMTPDCAPIIGESDEVQGFFHLTGFSGRGFMLSPVAGQIMTSLIKGEPPLIDHSKFSYHRFETGELFQDSLS